MKQFKQYIPLILWFAILAKLSYNETVHLRVMS